MGKVYEITSADGRKKLIDGDNGEILPDGATLRVPLMFRDSTLSPTQKGVADDAAFDAKVTREMRDFALLCQRSYEIRERAYLDSKRELADAWKTPTADRRRWHRAIQRDPEGREVGSQEFEEEDAVPGGQKAGDACTVDGRPGHLNARGECVPDRRDAMTADEGRAIKDAAWREMCAEMEGAWRAR